MKKGNLILAAFVLWLGPISIAQAESGHDILKACKAECPNAKTEDEVMKCMDSAMKAKKADKNFKKSECFHAYLEAEKKHGHSH